MNKPANEKIAFTATTPQVNILEVTIVNERYNNRSEMRVKLRLPKLIAK
jgi:hypothetical protein